MTSINLEAVEQLISYGFSPEIAKLMIRYNSLPCPLNSNVCLNAGLLGRYVELKEISIGDCDRVAWFLRQDHSVIQSMASVPDRYTFSEKQRQEYFKQPLEWYITHDLKEEIDAQLKLVIPKEEKRMDVYREMYCNGAWWDYDTINNICLRLQEISTGHTDLEEVVDKWWFVLFSLYSGTLQYIEQLKNLFVEERVWEIFRDTIINVREFTVQFNPFDRKKIVLEGLKGKYAPYLLEGLDE